MRAAAVIAVCVTAGCYSYLPLASVDPEPGTSLAVTLTDPGVGELERYLGPDIIVLRGRYVRSDDQGLLLAVTATETRRGDWHPWAGEAVRIPTADVASVKVRHFAKGRTLLLAGVSVAGLAATTAAFALGGGGPGTAPTKPPPAQ